MNRFSEDPKENIFVAASDQGNYALSFSEGFDSW